jgi:hypothetical protein
MVSLVGPSVLRNMVSLVGPSVLLARLPLVAGASLAASAATSLNVQRMSE